MAGTGPTRTVTGYTAEHMQEIIDGTLVGGETTPEGRLLLLTKGGAQIDAGPLPPGPPGPDGPDGPQGLQGDSSMPAGTISLWSGDADPPNWLICDGRAISRNTYASLFAAIGTKYGVGDGSTTFNIPNLQGTVPVGKDAAQTEFNTLGKTGGEKTHILTATEMPSHTHTQNAHVHTQNAHSHTQDAHGHSASSGSAGSHSHGPNSLDGFQVYVSGGASRTQLVAGTGYYAITGGSGGINNVGYAGSTDTVIAHTHTVSVGSTTGSNNSTTPTSNSTTATNNNTGGGGAHNNLQPYSVVNFIIKTTNGDTVGDSQLTQRVSALETTGATAAQAYVNDLIKGIELDGITDLDTVTTPGVYTQSANADASTALHYPEAYAGLLEVHSNANNGGNANMVWQTYKPYGNYVSRMWRRQYYTGIGGWTAWQRYSADNDTGWVTSGLDFHPAVNWSVDLYALRKRGSLVRGHFYVTYSGATLTAGSDANLGDQNAIFIMPTGWRFVAGPFNSTKVDIWRNGYYGYIGRVNTNGNVDLVGASYPGQTLTSGIQLEFILNYYSD